MRVYSFRMSDPHPTSQDIENTRRRALIVARQHAACRRVMNWADGSLAQPDMTANAQRSFAFWVYGQSFFSEPVPFGGCVRSIFRMVENEIANEAANW
jgi:hypothetical protein